MERPRGDLRRSLSPSCGFARFTAWVPWRSSSLVFRWCAHLFPAHSSPARPDPRGTDGRRLARASRASRPFGCRHERGRSDYETGSGRFERLSRRCHTIARLFHSRISNDVLSDLTGDDEAIQLLAARVSFGSDRGEGQTCYVRASGGRSAR